ncbi:MAG: hypothetical protein Q3962_02550 [Corynebacterium sp.]|nr:hypothetical protein [Corynebacterium sp.]
MLLTALALCILGVIFLVLAVMDPGGIYPYLVIAVAIIGLITWFIDHMKKRKK